MNLFQSIVCISLVLLAASVCRTEEDIDPLEELDPENAAEENQESTITNEQLEYTKGSFCGYCDYCKVKYFVNIFMCIYFLLCVCVCVFGGCCFLYCSNNTCTNFNINYY